MYKMKMEVIMPLLQPILLSMELKYFLKQIRIANIIGEIITICKANEYIHHNCSLKTK